MFARSFLHALVTPGAVMVALFAAGWPAPAPAVTRQAENGAAAPPDGAGLRVFHLGHSLVGRDIPAMLAQLSGDGHSYHSQLGWGTPLRRHWEPDEPIKGFEQENDHPRFRPAREAVASGDYDAVVLTEMVEIRDAIRYFQSGEYFAKWAALARRGDPGTRVYLYETWHRLDDPEGWLTRLDRDLERYWIKRILRADIERNAPAQPARLIPAGQVMAAFVREVEARGGVGNIGSREGLFRRREDGEIDPIHLNDLGEYLVALTHYAVLYGTSPVGLPHRLQRADGSPARAPTQAAARLMQDTVWKVVRRYPETGVSR